MKFYKLLSKNTKAQNLGVLKKLKSLECTANYVVNSAYITSKIKTDELHEEQEYNDLTGEY